MPPDEDFSFPTLSEPSTSSPPQMENPLMQRATVKHANAAAAPQAVQMPPPKPRPRQKLPMEKGYSQMDWMRTAKAQPQLGGGIRSGKITQQELAQHKSADDAWTSLRGRVYNITPYVKFHPGGKILLQGAGKDSTNLFNKYHAWVNAEMMLQSCLLGQLDPAS